MAIYLITGGAGFIGRHLCNELIGGGHRVRVLDCLVEQAHDAARPLPNEIEFFHADVRDRAALKKGLDGANGVFHLAAEVGVGQSMYEIARYVSANDLATAILMEEALNSGVERVVVASSMSIYGEGLYATPSGTRIEDARRTPAQLRSGVWDPVIPSGEPLTPVPTTESKRPDLTSVYALTKFDQERLVLMVAAAYGIEAVALRLFNVFGPGQGLSNPYTGVLAIFAGRLLNEEPPLVYEDGQQRRDFVHVSDVARAFRLAMERPGIDGEIFNIGSGHSYSIEDIAITLAGAMGRAALRPRILQKARLGDVRHCVADISKAERLLGYRPLHALETTVDSLVEWVSIQSPQDRVQYAQSELEQRGLVV